VGFENDGALSMYSVIIADAEGEPEVDGVANLAWDDVWKEMIRLIQQHPDEGYCEVSNADSGAVVMSVEYKSKEVSEWVRK
jgi:hypothetical protein